MHITVRTVNKAKIKRLPTPNQTVEALPEPPHPRHASSYAPDPYPSLVRSLRTSDELRSSLPLIESEDLQCTLQTCVLAWSAPEAVKMLLTDHPFSFARWFNRLLDRPKDENLSRPFRPHDELGKGACVDAGPANIS